MAFLSLNPSTKWSECLSASDCKKAVFARVMPLCKMLPQRVRGGKKWKLLGAKGEWVRYQG